MTWPFFPYPGVWTEHRKFAFNLLTSIGILGIKYLIVKLNDLS